MKWEDTFRGKYEQRVRNEFNRMMASPGHVVDVLRNDGLYRHIYCHSPGSGINAFHVVTWPGCLCYTGDLGTFVFRRTEDMLAFFRGSAKSHRYCMEKLIAADTVYGSHRYEPELVREAITDRVEELDGQDAKIFELQSEEPLILMSADDGEAAVHRAMVESGLWDGCDLPNLCVPTERMLLCLFAMEWLVAQPAVEGL